MVNFSNVNHEAVAKVARVAATKTIGVPGTAIWNGYIDEGERDQALIGQNRYRTYSDILANVSIVAAGTRYFLNLISNATWNIDPVDDTPEAKRFAEDVEFIIDQMNMPWRRVVRKAATYKFYGFSIQEWTAKRLDNGLIGIGRIDARPQSTIERWMRDDVGDIESVWQRSPQNSNEIEIPRDKLIYIVDDALNDSPEGLGLFRHLSEPTRRLKRFEQLEGYGFESDLRGIPVGRAPLAHLAELVKNGEITEAERTAIVQPLVDFMGNHIKNPKLSLLVDSVVYQSTGDNETPSNVKQWDLELLKAGSTSQGEIHETIRRLNEEIARILSMEGLLLGSGPNGTRSLSEGKSNNLAIVVDSTQKEMAETFDRDFIAVIGELNGWPKEMWPKFNPEPIRFKDVGEVTQALNDMAAAGAILAPDDPAINAVRGLLSMPPQTEENIQSNIRDAALTGNNARADIPFEQEESDVTSS